MNIDPELDLVLERVVPVPARRVWQAWTRPEQLVRWFTPAPWKTVDCRIDLRPGGEFFTEMASPEGERYPGTGCYLEVVEGQRLTWTDALRGGYRPNGQGFMTATLILEDLGDGRTRYTAIARHADPEARAKHEAMGFLHGWGAALDQLVAMVQAE